MTRKNLVLTVVGASVVVVVGALLPWATLGFISVAGTEGDGVITLILGLATAALALLASVKGSRWPLLVGAVLSVLVVLIAIYDISDVSSTASVGSGLWLTLIAGGVAVVAAVLASRASDAVTEAAAED